MGDNKTYINRISVTQIVNYTIALLLLSLLNSSAIQSQQQWKFYIAFEDGIGARDTVWFVWDTSATRYESDSLLGEYAVSMNYDEFNVFIPWVDTVKTIAFPYEFNFNITVRAMNFELPITITYDTSLFYADWLPPEPAGFVNIATLSNAYFYLLGFNDLSYWDMHHSDSVVSPDYELVGDDQWAWDPNGHFPIGVALGQYALVNIEKVTENKVSVFPNPATEKLIFTISNTNSSSKNYNLSVYNVNGKMIDNKDVNVRAGSFVYDVTELKAGVYFYKLSNSEYSGSGKFVVN